MERRAFVRQSFPDPTGGQGAYERVSVRDLAAGGISLVCDHPMLLDAHLLVGLTNATMTLSLRLAGRVVHTLLPDGRWLVGCALVPTISPEQLRRFLND